MAKERKKKRQEQGKEVVGKKEDEKTQEKERLIPIVKKEKETEAIDEVKKDKGKSMGENENENKNDGEEKEQGEKPEAPSAIPISSQPSPPEEVVLKVFMHCKGCAKKVRKSLKDLEGVEDVKTDCKTNTVVVKGKKAAQDPKKIADALYRKSGKKVEILSPAPVPLLPQNVAIAEMLEKKKEDKTKEKKESQGTIVAVLKVHMHCEACAEQIKTRILKLSGVEGVETTLVTSEVKIKGNFDPDMLVKYIYKRTGKHAIIIKQEQMTEEKSTTAADAKPVKNSEPENAKGDGKKEENSEEKSKEEKKEMDENNSPTATVVAVAGPSDGSKGIGDQHNYYYYPRYPMEYAYPYPYPHPHPYPHTHPNLYQYQYPYVPPPPPALQIFSDENPNACRVM